jgi:hypothetical protein
MNTANEFIEYVKSVGAELAPKANDRTIELAQNALQQMRAAMLPMPLIEIYKNFGGGIILGDAIIFGPEEMDRVKKNYEITGLVKLNRQLSSLPSMRGRVVWGRNALFWFGADAFGNMYMLDNLSLQPVRKYENMPYRAMKDCLIVGKI